MPPLLLCCRTVHANKNESAGMPRTPGAGARIEASRHTDRFRLMIRARIVFGLALVLGLVSGCGKSGASSASVSGNVQTASAVDASKVRRAFESADPSLKFPLEDELKIVSAGRYADALPGLRRLADNPKLSADQKQSLQELIQNLQSAAPANNP
jgi:hypothetical protein